MIDANGIHPTEDKVHAIHEAPMPQDITQLRAFVGLLNYYAKFIPQVATHVAPLYKLLEKDTKWVWIEECNNAFSTCKKLLTSEAVLVHYDTKKPVKLACDASSYGLGAVLSHISEDSEQPIACISHSLSKVERNYSQIEKEALALVLLCLLFQLLAFRDGQFFSQHMITQLSTRTPKHVQMLTAFHTYQLK